MTDAYHRGRSGDGKRLSIAREGKCPETGKWRRIAVSCRGYPSEARQVEMKAELDRQWKERFGD